MCGVIAYRSPFPNSDDFFRLKNLFEVSRIRGLHSFGVSWTQRLNSEIHTAKFYKLDSLLDFLDDLSAQRPQMLIGHNRYSTSGDYMIDANNQPLYLSSGLAMAFNGVVDQSPENLWADKYGYHFETQNDGEIAMRKYLEGSEPFLAWFRQQTFSFAGAFLDSRGIQVIRNRQRPLWIAESGVATFIASTEDIFKRAGFERSTTGPRRLWPFELIPI